jgi:hypothetical protein
MSKLSLEHVISICLLTPMGDPSHEDCVWGAPLFIWGDPGIGKSSRVHAASLATQLHFERVATPCHTAEDFGGIPIVTKKECTDIPKKADIADLLRAQISVLTSNGGVRRACSLGQIHRLTESRRGVLFLDEISRAPRQVQNALFSVVQERYAGDELLPGGVRVICAANPADQVIGAFETDVALANRFLHWEQAPSTVEDWQQFHMEKLHGRGPALLDYKSGEDAIRSDFKETYARTIAIWGGFLKTRSELLHNIPPEGSPDRGRGWPSERSHELAMRVTATCGCLGIDIQDQADLIQGCIGEGATTEWMSFILNADLPSAEQMLAGQWEPDVARLDRTHAAYGTLIAHITTRPTIQEKQHCAVPAWGMLEKLIDVGLSDIAKKHAQTLVNDRLGMSYGGAAVAKAARKVMAHLGETRLSEI